MTARRATAAALAAALVALVAGTAVVGAGSPASASPTGRPTSSATSGTKSPSKSPSKGPSSSSSKGSGTRSATPSPSTSQDPGSDDAEDAQPSAEEIAAAQARAQAQVELQKQQGAVADAQAALDVATSAAALALEQYSGALLAARTAQLEADRQEQLLLTAQLTLAAQKAVIGRWAREAYGDAGLGDNPALVTLLEGGTTDDLGRATMYLRHVGNSKGRAVEEYTRALGAQAAAASAAEAAQTAAQTTATEAEAAKQSADAAVAAQRDALAAAEAKLATAQDAALAATMRASNLAAARAIARSRAGSNKVTGEVGDCRGADTSVYANGEIPISALCPLWGTANQYLRADAAYAFNRLSQAYAQQFGEPVCVTDSYRDYATQVRLRQEKPNLAAVPGTSNHGWGTATDLCGGIQDFGTTTHDWMLRHAPEFGWFHPAWAEPSGSKPEPWHWEYAG